MKESIKIKQNKYFKLYRIFEMWLSLKEEGKSVATFLKRQSIKKVAVYGCGKVAEHLTFELQESGVQIAYFIDRAARPRYTYREWLVISPDQQFEKIDMIIVTVVSGERECVELLKKKTDAPIQLIEDILYECIHEVTFKE